jgi:hypothetical protein
MCKLLILTMSGLLFCGADGKLASDSSITPGWQLVFDSGLGLQYCVPSDDVSRAMGVPFEYVVQKIRLDAIKLPMTGECPK